MRHKILLLLLLITLFGTFLRINKFASSPPALFVDEADAGYQAYSLIKTQKDYFGNARSLHLQSFFDMRTPLYIYSTIPTILTLGLNEFSVRLPSLIFGILSIPLFFWLVRNLFRPTELESQKTLLGLIAALIIAILPWHIHYSRMAFEATLLLLLLILGLGFWSKWVNTSQYKYLWISFTFLALTPYAYSTAKLFTPILLIVLLLVSKRKLAKFNDPKIWGSLLLILVISLPLYWEIITGPGIARFAILSLSSYPDLLSTYQHLRWLAAYSPSYFPLSFIHTQTLANIFLNQSINFLYQILNSFFTAFSPQFLIFGGDPNLRHNLPISGVAGFSLTLLFYLGMARLINFPKSSLKYLLFALLILSPLPSSITIRGENHATRLFLLILPLVTIASLGLLFLIKHTTKSTLTVLILSFVVLITGWEVSRDQFLRLAVYPNLAYNFWNFGWKENVSKTYTLANQFDEVIIDDLDNTPVQTFYVFYKLIDPGEFQAFAKNHNTTLDNPPITTKKYFQGKITFTNFDPSWLDRPLPKRILALIPASKLSEKNLHGIKIVDKVTNPWGDPLYYFITNRSVSASNEPIESNR